jgi:protein SCO1/2
MTMAVALVLLAIAGGFLLGRARAGGAGTLHGSLIDPPLAATDFVLASGDGPVALSDFRGKVTVLFFGYTFCPDVCPYMLQRLRAARDLLGPAGQDVQVVFISVDPERDSPARTTAYARGFDPSFVGLSGSTPEVAAVASSFGIFYARAEPDRVAPDDAGEFYLVDHSATVLVLDRDGAIRLMWPGEASAEEMAGDLAWLLAN